MSLSATVIICAYTLERWEDIVGAVDSVERQDSVTADIVLVIDHNDELLDRARRVFDGISIVTNRHQQGLSGARNTGVEEAHGDIIVFLDDDAAARTDWLENLLSPFEDPSVAGVGGWIVPRWTDGAPEWFPQTFLWVLGCSYEGLPEEGGAIRNPIGASMALRRSVFDVAGGFADGLGRIGKVPLGGEETELCIRYSLARPEHRFVLSRGSIVDHRVPVSRLTWSYFLRRCYAEGLSKAVIAKRYGSRGALGSERRHVAVALPRELVRAMARLRDSDSRRLACLILTGGCVAVIGLASGRMRMAFSSASPESSAPVDQVTIDLDDPVRPATNHLRGDRAWVEVTMSGRVIGAVELGVIEGRLETAMVEEIARQVMAPPVSDADVTAERLPHITVVIPSLLSDDRAIEATLDTVLAQDYPKFEVVVVDNGKCPSPMGPRLVTRSPLVRVVHEPRPGISAARNRGVEESRGDVVAFTDDDVIADSGWLRGLGTAFARDDSIAAVGGIVLPAEIETAPQLWFEEFFGGFTQSFRRELLSLESPPLGDPLFPFSPGRFGAGCNFAARRDVLHRRPFDERLGTGTRSRGGEDLAFLVGLVLDGGTVAIEPGAMVRHFHRRSTGAFRRQVFGYGVGLGAMITSLVLERPSVALEYLWRLGPAFRRLTRSRMEGVPALSPTYPRWVKPVQLLGVLYGPVALARSAFERTRH